MSRTFRETSFYPQLRYFSFCSVAWMLFATSACISQEASLYHSVHFNISTAYTPHNHLLNPSLVLTLRYSVHISCSFYWMKLRTKYVMEKGYLSCKCQELSGKSIFQIWQTPCFMKLGLSSSANLNYISLTCCLTLLVPRLVFHMLLKYFHSIQDNKRNCQTANGDERLLQPR